MGRRLDIRVGIERVVPLVFLVHDLEEALQTERINALVEEAGRRLPAPIAAHVRKLHYSRAAMGGFAAAAFVAQLALIEWARRSPRAAGVLRALLVARLVNGPMHIAESLLLWRYVPGTATSPAIMLAAALLRSPPRCFVGRPRPHEETGL